MSSSSMETSDSCITSPIKPEDSNSPIIPPEDNTDQDSKENVDSFAYNIWQCMKRINSNLDFLSQTFNEQSDVVQTHKAQSAALDDDHFILLFPLREIEDVIELESRLSNNSSDFNKKLISCITPRDHDGRVLDLKQFVRTILRTLFTYRLAGNYSWRGFRGNFQIGNLKIVKLIFDMSKNKFKNATKSSVNVFIKEWIRYAKQRRNQLRKVQSF
ncbi:PREDICTED: uncharacterized protein LOC107168423 [Diuraphis noxia]|uniref:uncharacterized protein LOC107168423 n=1 Tax=Diuraphis noxia TaxID=143948 RepID=UPI0007635F95|nr:PREDICTED: uncharacterized protein LOC107168423 [Diuraphis noxia]